jgi:hypothetical protein
MAIGWVPNPLNDANFIWAQGFFGSQQMDWMQIKSVAPDPATFAIDVKNIVEEIRTGGAFVSGNRLNLWIEGRSPLVNMTWDKFGNTSPARLTIVQGGVTVYNSPLTASNQNGLELVGSAWYTSLAQCQESTNNAIGTDLSDMIATQSFNSVTMNPAGPVIDSATLTLTTDYARIITSGTMRVHGEPQVSSGSALWSSSHRPTTSSVTTALRDFTITADASKAGFLVNTTLGSGGFQNNFSLPAVPGAPWISQYPLGTFPNVISVASQSSIASLGSAAWYASASVPERSSYGYPNLPVGRIDSLPSLETRATALATIQRASNAFAAHDQNASRQKPLLFNAAIYPAGYDFVDQTMVLYDLCKNAWGMSGARYAYAEGASTATTLAATLAPPAGGAYTNANILALAPNAQNQPTYALFGNWLNLSPNEPYSPPYSTAWTPLPGAFGMHGPSQGHQYALQLVFGGGAAALSDDRHITTQNMQGQYPIFYNLLRGMTMLEAVFWAATPPGNVPTGDPLWAPFGPNISSAGFPDVFTPKFQAGSRRFRGLSLRRWRNR